MKDLDPEDGVGIVGLPNVGEVCREALKLVGIYKRAGKGVGGEGVIGLSHFFVL